MWIIFVIAAVVVLVTVLGLSVLFDPLSFMDEDERREFHRGGGL